MRSFDRSPICTSALASFLGVPHPPALEEEVQRIIRDQIYFRRIFFILNMGFCMPTAARTISLDSALAFEEIHRKAYADLGFDVVEIQPGPLGERTERILRHLQS